MNSKYTLLGVGSIKIDGGVLFGPVPKIEWEYDYRPDRKNRVELNVTSVLIETEDRSGEASYVIINPGMRPYIPEVEERFSPSPNHLPKRLKDLGIQREAIRHVILTSLRAYLASASMRPDRNDCIVPIFSHAEYHIGERAWQEAMEADELHKNLYDKKGLCKFNELRGNGVTNIDIISGDKEIIPGFYAESVKGTNGQIIRVSSGERLVIVGDMFPTQEHIYKPRCIPSFEDYPEGLREEKQRILERAEHQGELLVMSLNHDGHVAGYCETRHGKRDMRWIPLKAPV